MGSFDSSDILVSFKKSPRLVNMLSRRSSEDGSLKKTLIIKKFNFNNILRVNLYFHFNENKRQRF